MGKSTTVLILEALTYRKHLKGILAKSW